MLYYNMTHLIKTPNIVVGYSICVRMSCPLLLFANVRLFVHKYDIPSKCTVQRNL